MLKIGLTGGIGSGKSTATRFFSELQVPVIDADVIAHQLSQPNQAAFQEIVKQFGKEVLHADGSLNRDKLRQRIFADPAQKQCLETLLHPLIYAEIAAQTQQLNAAYCLVSIPLLVETRALNPIAFQRIIVVDCPLELQIQRVKARSHLTEADIHRILATQASREQRLSYANVVLDNSKTLTHLAEQVKKLHNSFLSLSST